MLGQIFNLIRFDPPSVRSVIDILALAVIVYQLLLLIRGTRAVQMLLGILSIALFYFLTGPDRMLELPVVHRVVGGALFFTPFVVVVLFQNHIRRVLASFGTNPLRTLALASHGPERIADEVVLAATSLAGSRRGALIVFEREQGLRTFIETGIPLDALVSYDLLTTIFLPGSPLHDGAVIIADGRIRACCCYLPLTSNPPLTKEFGSRHRAGIGITEETDAVAIVVSEERGTISLARGGLIHEDLEARELQEILKSLLISQKPLLARLGWPGGQRPEAPASDSPAPPSPGSAVDPASGTPAPRRPADREPVERGAMGESR